MNWDELENASIGEILSWAETQPWCRPMMECAQDAEWHAEGDVWTHTKMVCAQLTELEDWPLLSEKQRATLKFTALFHDAAKPQSSKVDPNTGRITSPNHAVKGEQLVRCVMRELGCELQTREQIARLVRYHGRPAFLLERDQPAHEVVRLSWLVENRLLYLFAIADTRGRDTDAMSRPEENLQFWKMQAEELDCYEQPYCFANNHARFTFFRKQEPNLHYVPYEDFACQVTMVSGLPGSGKDTWLSRNREGLPVVSLDAVREELAIEPTDNQGAVVQLARERCREFLRAGTSFAFNATNILKETRRRWIDLFSDYNASIEMVYIEPQLNQIIMQNRNRPASIPEHVIRKLATKCEPPTQVEAHTLIMVD